MSTWTEQAARLEQQCLLAIEGRPPEEHRSLLDAICFYRWFAWYPVKTIGGKWRWLRYVKRHWSEPYYEDLPRRN